MIESVVIISFLKGALVPVFVTATGAKVGSTQWVVGIISLFILTIV